MNRTLPERIFICGFMGAGKSTVGKKMAGKMNLPFHDLDSFIEREAEKTIPAIFEEEGEEGFRKKEKAALLQIIRDKKGVIALGGGALQNQHLVDYVKANGLLVLLDAPFDTMVNRISDGNQRPLLLDDNGKMRSVTVLKNELRDLYKQRLPFYEQAEIAIKPADYKTKNELVTALIKKIKYHVALY